MHRSFLAPRGSKGLWPTSAPVFGLPTHVPHFASGLADFLVRLGAARGANVRDLSFSALHLDVCIVSSCATVSVVDRWFYSRPEGRLLIFWERTSMKAPIKYLSESPSV